LVSEPQSKYEHLIARAQPFPPAPTIIVHPWDEASLRGATDAAAVTLADDMVRPTDYRC
jgi:phosphate acetyltransferase